MNGHGLRALGLPRQRRRRVPNLKRLHQLRRKRTTGRGRPMAWRTASERYADRVKMGPIVPTMSLPISTTTFIVDWPEPPLAAAIAVGPDGALWFTGAAWIGRATTDGDTSYFDVPGPARAVHCIAAGPDDCMGSASNLAPSARSRSPVRSPSSSYIRETLSTTTSPRAPTATSGQRIFFETGSGRFPHRELCTSSPWHCRSPRRA